MMVAFEGLQMISTRAFGISFATQGRGVAPAEVDIQNVLSAQIARRCRSLAGNDADYWCAWAKPHPWRHSALLGPILRCDAGMDSLAGSYAAQLARWGMETSSNAGPSSTKSIWLRMG
jgi:hypothetical protein